MRKITLLVVLLGLMVFVMPIYVQAQPPGGGPPGQGGAIKALQDQLDQEIADRQAADNDLQSSIIYEYMGIRGLGTYYSIVEEVPPGVYESVVAFCPEGKRALGALYNISSNNLDLSDFHVVRTQIGYISDASLNEQGYGALVSFRNQSATVTHTVRVQAVCAYVVTIPCFNPSDYQGNQGDFIRDCTYFTDCEETVCTDLATTVAECVECIASGAGAQCEVCVETMNNACSNICTE